MKKRHCWFIVLFLVLALIGLKTEAFAEQTTSVKDCIEQPEVCGEPQEDTVDTVVQDTGSSSVKVGLTVWDFVKMILATIFVVALLYAILRFVNKKGSLFKSSQIIENLGGTTLGTNRSVQIIKVGSRILVVGVGENVQLLTEIEDEKEYEHILVEYNNKMDQLAQPSDVVSKVINKMKNTSKFKTDNNAPFQTILKKQLEELSNGRKELFDEIRNKKGSDKP